MTALTIGTLPEGHRNDGLTRLAGALRRKGKTQSEIEAELIEANTRRCRPPLADDEVRVIAASVSRYAPGGPDPLEAAWQAIQSESYASNYKKFLALVYQLQKNRPGQPIALPLVRIAELLGCDWTQPRAYRKRAVLEGVILRVSNYVAHRRAATYRVTHPLGEENSQTHPLGDTFSSPTRGTPTKHPLNGLVGDSLVGDPQESPLVGDMEFPLVGDLSDRQKQVLRLAARGFQLFPCRPLTKKPALKNNWQKLATADPKKLARWFRDFPEANWACVTGRASGVWVLDCDGQAAFAALFKKFREYGCGLDTLITVTGREMGRHFWFQYPPDAEITCKTGLKNWHDGIDVRGSGGYVMVPPSIWVDDPEKAKVEEREPRPSRPYEFLNGDEDHAIAATPAWLICMVREIQDLETPEYPASWDTIQ